MKQTNHLLAAKKTTKQRAKQKSLSLEKTKRKFWKVGRRLHGPSAENGEDKRSNSTRQKITREQIERRNKTAALRFQTEG